MAWLLFILVPIVIYWAKVASKFSRQEKAAGRNKVLIQIVLMLLTLALVWWIFIPELTVKKPLLYMHPKGLLLFIITVVVIMIWPIIMEFQIDKRNK